MHPNRNVRNVMNVQNEVTIGQLLANIKMAERLNPDIRTNYPYQLYSVIQADWGGGGKPVAPKVVLL